MRRKFDQLLHDLIAPPPAMPAADFRAPAGAPALFAPDSISWRIMKNPVALLVGGVAAVILELAEPRVRSGVWEHTSFRGDPVKRMRRTGYAAWITVYAPADAARALAARVNAMHRTVAGATPSGAPYRADDEDLLTWVHATASFGFVEAYNRFVHPLSPAEIDSHYREGAVAGELFGAPASPRSAAQWDALFAAMTPKLEASPIIFEFLDIVRKAPVTPMRALQRLAVRGAVEITPPWAREILGLGPELGLRKPGYEALLKALGAAGERFVLADAPPAQACLRLGLPADYLYR
jgi:uncharacterized protein (DUF2236 family)